MQSRLIAFTGKMGVGKSTAIETLNKYLQPTSDPHPLVLIKFAQPLYDIQEYVYERIGKPVPKPKDRKLLQWLGTEWGRETHGANLWVDIWKENVEVLRQHTENLTVVCDDCRFDNEAQAVRELGGQIVHIMSSKNAERIDTTGNQHKSEAGIDICYVDYFIENDGSIEQYRRNLHNLFHKLDL